MARAKTTRKKLIEFALTLPGAYQDDPWGGEDVVAKVNKKIFVFFGSDDSPEPGMAVKLRDSHDQAMSVPGSRPSGYGLGRAGWVSLAFLDTTPPLDVLRDWIEESYRIVAPKRMSAQLDERPRR